MTTRVNVLRKIFFFEIVYIRPYEREGGREGYSICIYGKDLAVSHWPF